MTDETKAPTVTLGGNKYPIGEFTYGDQEKMQPLFNLVGGDDYNAAQARSTIVFIGLHAADPTGFDTIEKLRAIKKVTAQEVMDAFKDTCIASGLKWGAATGEAKPVTEPAANPSQSGTGAQEGQS